MRIVNAVTIAVSATTPPHACPATLPARVLTGLNGALCGKFDAHYVTAAYLFVDMEKSSLHYSAAGHPPLMLASRAVGNVREIEENGLMLGMFPEAAYSSVEIRVGPKIAVCSTRTASSKPRTPRRRNSAGHVAGNSWKLIVTFLPLASLTPSSTTSPVFRATTPPARRRTTLPSSSSTFSRPLWTQCSPSRFTRSPSTVHPWCIVP